MIRYLLNIINSKPYLYNRLIDDLNYYMIESIDKNSALYYITLKDDVILIYTGNNNYWNMKSLNTIIRTALRDESTYFLSICEHYMSYLNEKTINDIHRDTNYFKNMDSVREELKYEMTIKDRKKKITKIADNIDE